MRWRLLLVLAALSMLFLLAVLAAVAVLVPIRFTVSVPGAIRPPNVWRVTAAESGVAMLVRPAGPVAKGDCLFQLDDGTPRRRLAEVEAQLDLLDRRLVLERGALDQQTLAWELERAVVKTEIAATATALAQVEGEARQLAADVAAKSLAENRVDAELAASELDILRRLAAELSVPAMELAQGEARARKTALQVERARIQEQARVLAEEHAIARLREQLAREQARDRQIEGRRLDERPLAEIEFRILQLQTEKADLEQTIRHKTCLAEADGEWGGLAFVAGEYVPLGAQIGVLRQTRGMIFEGEATAFDYVWLAPQAEASLRLQAYPFLRYGTLPATVTELEARTEEAVPRFLVKLAIDEENARFQPSHGLVGEAQVVVFHGSLANYLLAEPPSVRQPYLKPIGFGQRFTDWLKKLEQPAKPRPE
ncbi:MAG: hypothetical protein RBU25_11990 [Lentisphaeria bacterium]|nr:hypothetical protein [Lentisphaeria bacterium]